MPSRFRRLSPCGFPRTTSSWTMATSSFGARIATNRLVAIATSLTFRSGGKALSFRDHGAPLGVRRSSITPRLGKQARASLTDQRQQRI